MSRRGHRRSALIARRGFADGTCRWQRSGHHLQAAHSAADASGRRRAEESKAGARYRPLGPMEGSNESWRTAWSVVTLEGSNRLFPDFWPVVGCLTRSGSREFKGRPRDSKTIGSVQIKPSFPRSIDKSLNRRLWCSRGHSPKHPTCWVRRGLARIPGLSGPWPVKIS